MSCINQIQFTSTMLNFELASFAKNSDSITSNYNVLYMYMYRYEHVHVLCTVHCTGIVFREHVHVQGTIALHVGAYDVINY